MRVRKTGETEYFDFSTDGAPAVLHPLQRSRADEVRDCLRELGIEAQDVAEAIRWARTGEQSY